MDPRRAGRAAAVNPQQLWMSMQPNYYEILEIPSDADEREIKRAYHRLARDLHPDKAGSPEETRQFEERFAQVSAAYNMLKDADKRAEYDRQYRSNGSAGAGSPPQTIQRPRPTTPTASVLTASRGVPGGSSGSPSPTGPLNSTSPAAGPARAQLGLTPEKVQIAQKAFARGMQFFKENQFSKAVDFFEAAIQNNDTEPNYHARLALALINARKSATRAIEAAQRACELDPYNLELKFTLAYIFETIGSKTNAQKVYEDIVRWDAGNQRALAALKELKGKKSGPFGLGGLKPSEGPSAASAAPYQGSQAQANLGGSAAKSGGFLQGLLDKFKKS